MSFITTGLQKSPSLPISHFLWDPSGYSSEKRAWANLFSFCFFFSKCLLATHHSPWLSTPWGSLLPSNPQLPFPVASAFPWFPINPISLCLPHLGLPTVGQKQNAKCKVLWSCLPFKSTSNLSPQQSGMVSPLAQTRFVPGGRDTSLRLSHQTSLASMSPSVK